MHSSMIYLYVYTHYYMCLGDCTICGMNERRKRKPQPRKPTNLFQAYLAWEIAYYGIRDQKGIVNEKQHTLVWLCNEDWSD